MNYTSQDSIYKYGRELPKFYNYFNKKFLKALYTTFKEEYIHNRVIRPSIMSQIMCPKFNLTKYELTDLLFYLGISRTRRGWYLPPLSTIMNSRGCKA